MALLTSPGATGILLGVPMTKRDDISELLMPSLAVSNNIIGAIPVAEETVDNVCRWDETSLNPSTITDTTSGGQTTVSTNLNILSNQVGLVRTGWILSDISSATGGLGGGEQVRITATTGTVIQIARGVNGTTATDHAQNAVWQIINPAELEVSNLNADQSRPRVPLYNFISRHARDVIVSTEQQMRSNRGAAVGIPNEIKFELNERIADLAQQMSWAVLYSRPFSGPNGNPVAPSVSAGDYSTYAGIYAFLDGTFNPTATVYNWGTEGFGVGQVERAMNLVNQALDANGVVIDWVAVPSLGAQDIGRISADRIRLVQSDMTRGQAVNVFRTLLGNELTVMRDSHIEGATGIGEMFFLDSSRIRIRPMAESWCRLITAPTLLDAGVARIVVKYSLEMRNTGSNTGQANAMIINCDFTQS